MIETYYSVRCDDCGRETEAVRGDSVALEQAEALGYALNVNDQDRDLCPTCKGATP